MKHWTLLMCAFVLSGCMEGGGAATDKALAPPAYFIADQLGAACTRDEQGRAASRARAATALSKLDRNAAFYVAELRRSNSLTVNKDAFAANWTPVLFNSYAAAASGDQALARTIIDGLKVLARNNRYQSEPGLITRDVALRAPPCYSAGPDTPCPSHTPRFVSRMYENLMISAAVLRPFTTADDLAVLRPWFQQGYTRFVREEATSDQDGLYDFANSGLSQLAYAALTDDMALAQRELTSRKRDFLRRLEPSGYIDQNSYRGVRGFWYHTYGLDPALSYALVAREWGVDYFADPELGPRLRAAVEKTALGIRDHAEFRSVGNRGSSFSSDPRDTKAHVHQSALNIYPIAAREFGIRLPRDARYEELRRLESYSQTSGLSAQCYYSGR